MFPTFFPVGRWNNEEEKLNKAKKYRGGRCWVGVLHGSIEDLHISWVEPLTACSGWSFQGCLYSEQLWKTERVSFSRTNGRNDYWSVFKTRIPYTQGPTPVMHPISRTHVISPSLNLILGIRYWRNNTNMILSLQLLLWAVNHSLSLTRSLVSSASIRTAVAGQVVSLEVE